jgi:tRNA pseudouridine38-40 synthase
VRPPFDPRRDARWRRYRYTILNRPAPPALDRHRVTHLALPLDWAAIEAGLAHLPGRHDFSAFRSAHCQATRTELTMLVARHVADPPLHHFDFLCRSFLHNMVRLMSGLLIEIGLGMHAPEVVATACERAPPHGPVSHRRPHGAGSPGGGVRGVLGFFFARLP